VIHVILLFITLLAVVVVARGVVGVVFDGGCGGG